VAASATLAAAARSVQPAMTFNRTTSCAALTALLGLLAGCGGSGSSSTTASRPPGATPVVNRAHARLAAGSHLSQRAQFVAAATAINLRPGDVPGFLARAEHKSHAKTGNEAFESNSQFKQCLHSHKEARAVYKASSQEFKVQAGLNFKQAHSEVQILPTAAAARREIATVDKMLSDPRITGCLSRVFDSLGGHAKALHENGGTLRIKVGALHVLPIPIAPALTGTGGGAGFDVNMKVTYIFSARGRHAVIPVPAYLDGLAFVEGRAGVTLTTLTFGSPFPAGLEGRLFSTLISRGLAAGQEYPALKAPAGSSPS
jgi:hypothetical protein